MEMSRAEKLNRECACDSVGAAELAGFYSKAPVFVGTSHLRQMASLIAAIHRVIERPLFEQTVLAEVPSIARVRPGAKGVFLGFDFHVGADGPKLIEINTNAGGAMINAAAEWRHPDCCDETNPVIRLAASREQLEADFIAMFLNEWRLARGDRVLRTIAIVDDQPEKQFLHPEFRLFEELFARHGIDAFITDARALEFSGGQLKSGDRVIDLAYNRVTDFYFEDKSHEALREAYLQDAAVITPHPRAHALYSDKRNLARLTDADFLRAAGVSDSDSAILQSGIPLTRRVEGDAEVWWSNRRKWFFKPASGFGSRGAYRGDKITRRAFGEVMGGGYVAQALALPGERLREGSGGPQSYKVDLRLFVYDGVVQLMAARLYQGQTTNFRTAGGGFAPVIELRDA